MTPEDLSAIEARAEKATLPFELHNPGWLDGERDPRVLANLQFFGAAMLDVPRLVAEVRRLRAWLEWLHERDCFEENDERYFGLALGGAPAPEGKP